jgi:predicted ATPase
MTIIAPASRDAYKAITAASLSVLVGRNNSGKSFILRKLATDLGQGAAYLGPARFQNFNTLSPYGPSSDRRLKKYQQMLQHLTRNNQNYDNSPVNLQQAIAELNDEQRAALFTIIDGMLGSKTQIRPTIADNSMSQRYVQVDDHNLSFTSTGYRLVATLLTSLLDKDYTRFLIDEPELGLSPETQGAFADFILDPKQRASRLPHAKSIVIATHSPVFVNRTGIATNFFVDRVGHEITIKQLRTVQEIADLQFRLLGNRFETLFLPSAIVLVEGKTDYNYIDRLIAMKYPDLAISVVRCNNDSRIREVLAIARQMLKDLSKSPYANRIFAVVDSVHGAGLVAKLHEMGIALGNVVVWSANGIEHFYPRAILEAIFGNFDGLSIRDDVVTANGISKKKAELSREVCAKLAPDTVMPDELQQKLLGKIDAVRA